MAFVEIDNLGVLGYVVTHFGNLNFQIFHFSILDICQKWLSLVTKCSILFNPFSFRDFHATHVTITWLSSHVDGKLEWGISEW